MRLLSTVLAASLLCLLLTAPVKSSYANGNEKFMKCVSETGSGLVCSKHLTTNNPYSLYQNNSPENWTTFKEDYVWDWFTIRGGT